MILLLLFGAVLAVLLVDAASKLAVMGGAVAGRPPPVSRWGIRVVTNQRGSVMGLGVRAAVALLAAVSAAAAVLSLLVDDPGLALGLGAMVGGATANVVDRVRRGAVIDFVAAGPWPVFNLADGAIVAGLALCGWALL